MQVGIYSSGWGTDPLACVMGGGGPAGPEPGADAGFWKGGGGNGELTSKAKYKCIASIYVAQGRGDLP